MITNQFDGTIDIPEFYAKVQGELTDNLVIKNIVPEIQERSLNSQFYSATKQFTNLYPLTGSLSGKLIEDPCIPFKCSGLLQGNLTYHSLENKENTPTWQIAPQVGDFFRLSMNEIEEEYEITQIVDRTLTNNNRYKSIIRKIYVSMYRCQKSFFT